MDSLLPIIPAKRYFTIGEVGELCGVKPHVLRYWEQEFTQLRPVKRRGNRRYYQRHEVMMIRRIRGLLYDQGFTISGARNKLLELMHNDPQNMDVAALYADFADEALHAGSADEQALAHEKQVGNLKLHFLGSNPNSDPRSDGAIRESLMQIRDLLSD
jgi:DNA-binding transcriptional MerR regulator